MKRGTPNHRKMHRLARRLRVSLAEAVGTMELLWHWVADYLPRGDIGKSEDWEIAAAVHWSGEPLELIYALIEEHWIDESPACRLIVHDWSEHCEESVHTKLARGREFFADGSKPRLGKLGGTERTAAESFYASVIDRDAHLIDRTGGLIDRKNVLENLTVSKQAVLPFSGAQNQPQAVETQNSLDDGRNGASKGPQKDLAKPSQAKPSLIASERDTQEQMEPLARLSPDQIADRLFRFMGGARRPDPEIVQNIAGILEGHPIETLDAFLQGLNGRKIKSYGFFPMVLKKELRNITAAEPPVAQKSEPEESEEAVSDYYQWRLAWIKTEYLRKHGEVLYRKHLKSQEKALVKEYPSIAVMTQPDREILAERRFLNQLASLPEMQIPKFGDYKAKVQSGEISAGRVPEFSDDSRTAGKLVSVGGSL